MFEAEDKEDEEGYGHGMCALTPNTKIVTKNTKNTKRRVHEIISRVGAVFAWSPLFVGGGRLVCC